MELKKVMDYAANKNVANITIRAKREILFEGMLAGVDSTLFNKTVKSFAVTQRVSQASKMVVQVA